MTDILKRDITGECEGECRDLVRDGEEERQDDRDRHDHRLCDLAGPREGRDGRERAVTGEGPPTEGDDRGLMQRGLSAWHDRENAGHGTTRPEDRVGFGRMLAYGPVRQLLLRHRNRRCAGTAPRGSQPPGHRPRLYPP